jgi:hypothetical protein
MLDAEVLNFFSENWQVWITFLPGIIYALVFYKEHPYFKYSENAPPFYSWKGLYFIVELLCFVICTVFLLNLAVMSIMGSGALDYSIYLSLPGWIGLILLSLLCLPLVFRYRTYGKNAFNVDLARGVAAIVVVIAGWIIWTLVGVIYRMEIHSTCTNVLCSVLAYLIVLAGFLLSLFAGVKQAIELFRVRKPRKKKPGL